MDATTGEVPGLGLKRRKTEILDAAPNGVHNNGALQRIARGRATDDEDESDEEEDDQSSEEVAVKGKTQPKAPKKSDDQSQQKSAQKGKARAQNTGTKRKRPVLEPRGKLVSRIEELERETQRLTDANGLLQESNNKLKEYLKISDTLNRQLANKNRID